jgi:Protein of unknown function (DUF3540)
MSNVAILATGRAAALRVEDYLGPAEVLETTDEGVRARLRGGAVVSASLALALPYAPVIGDLLLLIGKGEEFYAIGILRGSGKTSLRLQGDVDLHAEGGALHLSADKGVRIEAPEVDIETGRLRTVATSVVQKCTSLYQRVSALLSVHAGQSHTVVDEASFSRSKSAAILTEETVTINGKQIHLG